MANQPSEVMAEPLPGSPEAIEKQIAEKREELATKIDTLGDVTGGSVTGTIQSVAEAVGTVTDTMDKVGETVGKLRDLADPETLVQMVRDTVGSIPLKATVRRRPWATVGGAAVAGVIVGLLTSRPRRADGAASGPSSFAAPITGPIAGLFDKLVDRFGTEVRTVAESAFDTAGAALSEKVASLLPAFGLNPDSQPANGTGPADPKTQQRVTSGSGI
jgi:ElaB/YqjD/DUF883 family membrane-anchored ribosome-binding protein